MAGRLMRVFGMGFGVAVAVGATVGGGILKTPGEVVARLPSASLVMAAWIAGGLYAFLGACALAELAAMTPKAGGFTVFARRALGPYAGFVVGWTDWLVSDGSVAALAILLGESVVSLATGAPIVAGGMREKAVAIACVVALALVQARGARLGGRVQAVVSALKGLAIVALGVACFAHGRAPADPAPMLATIGQSSVIPALTLAAAVVALQSVIFTYDGWYGVIYFGEELRDPGRDAPRAMFGTVVLVTALYVVFNAALLYALPRSQLAGHPQAAELAARTVFGDTANAMLQALIVVSAAGTMSALQLGTPRILYALGRESRLDGVLGRINDGGTPSTALMVSVVLEVAFIITGTFEQVVAVLSVFLAANYSLAFASVFALRRREPDAQRPFRAWGHPWTTAAALAGALAFVASGALADTTNTLIALGVLAISFPLFRVTRSRASA